MSSLLARASLIQPTKFPLPIPVDIALVRNSVVVVCGMGWNMWAVP